MIAKIVTGASFGGCTAYAYGKDQAEVVANDGIIPDNPKIAAKCFEIQSHQIPCDRVQRRLLSIKMAVFMDRVCKNQLLSTKKAVFMDKM